MYDVMGTPPRSIDNLFDTFVLWYSLGITNRRQRIAFRYDRKSVEHPVVLQ